MLKHRSKHNIDTVFNSDEERGLEVRTALIHPKPSDIDGAKLAFNMPISASNATSIDLGCVQKPVIGIPKRSRCHSPEPAKRLKIQDAPLLKPQIPKSQPFPLKLLDVEAEGELDTTSLGVIVLSGGLSSHNIQADDFNASGP